jgi:hypothetical protein
MKYLSLIFCLLLAGTVCSQNLVPFICDSKWGYADPTGKIVIPCQFDEALPFYEGRALIVNYIYDENGFSRKDDAFIDSTGKVVFYLESNALMDQPASRFSNGISLVQNYKNKKDSDGSYISLVDKSGKELNRIINASLTSPYGDFSNYQTTFNQFGFYVANNYDYAAKFIYKDTKTVKTIDGYNLFEFKKGGYAVGEHKDGFALIDSGGQVVIPPSSLRLIEYGDELVSFIGKNNKVGFVNLKGKVEIKPDFETALSFSEGMAVFGAKVKSGEEDGFKFGYINKKGKIVLPAIYDDANDFSEGLAEVRIADSLFFIDKDGKKVLGFSSQKVESEFIFDYRSGFRNGRAIVNINGSVGWIDRSGNFIIYPMFKGLQLGSPINTIFDFDNGITKLSLPGFQYCYIDQNGFPFVQNSFSILQKMEQVSYYSKPDLDSILEEKGDFWPKKVKRFSGQNLDKAGIKTEWIEISDYSQSKFVLSTDFYTNCYMVSNKKGAKIYEDETDATIYKYLPFGTMLYPDDSQILPGNGRISAKSASIVYQSDENYNLKTFYIDVKDIQKMEKP